MTSLKHFFAIVGWILGSSVAVLAADDSASVSSAAATTAGSTAHKSVHHRKHHTKADTAATTNAAPAPGAPAAVVPTTSSEAQAGSGSSTHVASSKSGGPGSEAKPAAEPTSSTNASAPAATSTTAPGASTLPAGATPTPHHSRHHHGTAAIDATNAPAAAGLTATAPEKQSPTAAPSTTPIGSGPTAAAKPGSALPAATAITKTTTTTTGKSRRHRHGKTGLPQPAIVVPQMPPPPVLPNGTAPSVTLPTAPPIAEGKAPAGLVPTVETGLPVARPGAGTTASLPVVPARPPASATALLNFPFHDFTPTRPHTRTYSWKMNIVTTVFWIGESSTPLSGATNKVSAWDMSWVNHNGGADDQGDMSGYASADHASMLNPFYVALPFNDLAYPDKTQQWLPAGWYKPARHGEKPVSSCKDRWVEIKNRAGRYCFAQWEDVGPVVTDDAEYVFGSGRPSAYQGRGLDVSPAVAKYLGFDSTAYTSWRFVDDEDVLPGMWLRYDEQALLFRAMKEQMRENTTPRMQDLGEPLPDPDDSSQKKTGPSRG